jgi:ABC-type spermidine/putrescine transport system permease subunit II
VHTLPFQYNPRLHTQSLTSSEPEALVLRAGHAVHTEGSEAPEAVTGMSWYVFAAHSVHTLPFQYNPRLHTQSLTSSEPEALVLRAGHAVHTEESEAPEAVTGMSWYVFAAHSVHTLPFQYNPRLHTQSLTSSEPEALVLRAGHAVHTEESEAPEAVTGMSWYVFAAHSVHTLPFQYVVVGHRQEDWD